MTKYLNKVGPGYVPPPLANDDQVRQQPPQPGEMIMGCTDPEADNFMADANSDDGSCTYTSIDGDDDMIDDVANPPLGLKTAGYMGIPKIAWIAIIGVGVYYAYSKGMFKKLLK